MMKKTIVNNIYAYQENNNLCLSSCVFSIYSDEVVLLRFPLARSDDLRAPALRGPVSEVGC